MDVKAVKKRVIYLESQTESKLRKLGYSNFSAKRMKIGFKNIAKDLREYLKKESN